MKNIQMPKRMQELIDSIFCSDRPLDEWFALEKETEEYLKTVSKEELELFTDSGAGETLYMICSGLRYMEEQNKKAS